MVKNNSREPGFVNWTGWKEAGHPLPGVDAHRPMMPYARSSAAEARSLGKPGRDFREAAVMVGVEGGGEIMLIERTPEKGPHGGQMALPGGAREAGESLQECALREWREELGLDSQHAPLQTPVALTEVHVVPSGFVVRPFIAPVSLPLQLHPEVVEVARVHRVRLEHLWDVRYRKEQAVRIQMPGVQHFQWKVPGFAFPDTPFIWGATALILSEVADWGARWASEA